MNSREIEALLKLLADEDESIAAVAAAALKARREPALEALRAAAAGETGLLRERAGAILDELDWEELVATFTRWGPLTDAGAGLERGLVHVARFAYPHLNAAAVSAALDELAGGIRVGDAGPEERLPALTEALFGPAGLRGDRDDYYNPENSYLHRVLERRRGIPISLASVFLLVGRRLGEPVHGIGLPGHFLAGYGAPPRLRYLDVFNGGRELGRPEIEALLARHGLPLRSQYLEPVSDRAVLVRTLNNLVGIFAHRDDTRRAGVLVRCRAALVAPLS